MSLEGLPLHRATAPDWFPTAARNLDAVLVDHAHCEQKAAATALSLMGRYAADDAVVRTLLAVAYEELGHFKQVVDLLRARGRSLTAPRPDRYVRALREWSFRHKGGAGPKADAFLAAAFVEARSCERFRLLARGFGEDPERADLHRFYARLADAESRHWESFRDLAYAAAGPAQVDRRLQQMARAEAAIVDGLPVEPRMH